MSRIAIIADVHGNLPALEAALDDISKNDVDETIVAGDLVGRGPQGSAVVARIRELGLKSVRGNHEDYLLSFRRHEVPEDWLEADEWACSRWMAAELGERDVNFIDSLPFTMTADTDDAVRIVHGSPTSYNEGLGPWLDEDALYDHLRSVEEPMLVCAHTHRAAQWSFEDGQIVNVGSVGLPFNRDWRAQYAIFERQNKKFDVEFRKVEYDRERTLKAYRSSGFLESGGATALLLKKELEHATSFLVPFLKWADVLEVAPVMEHVDDFLESFDPSLSMREQFQRLTALASE